MGSYITSADLTARYSILTSWPDLNNSLIIYAEAELNQYLAPCFPVPFTSVPLAIKDITIDLAYCKSLRAKDPEKAAIVCKEVMLRILAMQLTGYVSDSGTIAEPGDASNEAWSSTQDYIPLHSMLGPESTYTHVDSNQQQAEVDERT